MNGDLADDPQEEPEWLREFRAQHPQWEPPDPRDRAAMLAACDSWYDDYIEIADEQGQRNVTDELKRFLIETEALAWAAEANDIDSAPLIAFLHDTKRFYVNLTDRLPIPIPEIHVLLKRLKFKLESQRPARPTTHSPAAATLPQAPAEPPPPRVVLNGPGRQPHVLGKKKNVLSQPQYNVIQTLLPIGESGLSKDELEKKSGHEDARRILKRLHDSDPDWAQVIHLPGRKGKRYRIF